MNSTLREGLNIKVAFESALNRKIIVISDFDSSLKETPSSVPIMDNHAAEVSEQFSNKIWFKERIYLLSRYIYKKFKPIIRPILLRVRSFFIDSLTQEIINDSRQTADALARKNQLMMDAIKEKIQKEFLGVSVSTVQAIQCEVQKITDAAKQELLLEFYKAKDVAVQKIQEEIQSSSASILKDYEQLRAGLWPRLDLIEVYGAAAARRVAINCLGNEVLVRTEVGFLLCSAGDHALLSCLLDTGELERGTRILIQNYLSSGDVYVDVGANVGMHALAAARAMQGHGKIIAFEPFEPTKRMLEKSIWMNGFSRITEIHQAAVSNVIGKGRFFIGATSGHHSLYELGPLSNNAQGHVEVPLVRLDSVIDSAQRIDLIKIDAEGAELEVIEGGASLIAGNPDIALIVEFGSSHLLRTGRTPSQWFKTFSQLGLDYRVINNESGALEEWSLDALEKVDSVNVFFAFPGSYAWSRLS